MPLISTTPMLEQAKNENYGIVAFNVHSFDSIYWVLEAAAEMKSPVILQTTVGTVKSLGAENIVKVATAAADYYRVPTGLHLDHCTDYEVIKQAVRAGYTSVMIDASRHAFAENVRQTKQVMELTANLGVNVEAELGKVGGVEEEIVVSEKDAQKAVPEECKEFVALTGVPTLAPAIGTAHGIYKGEPDIDFTRIEQISKMLDIPLVLHGGSAVPEEDVRKCVALGMAKVNVSTELKNAYSIAIREHFSQQPDSLDPRAYLQTAKEAAKAMVISKIKMVGSEGKVAATPIK
ncbi:fructose-bisphosphate aldolase [Virgibacillus pantothenticus]|uniref:class II fructose-bisphosphate aldolase n=1 Tax=Virgibacillus TaxID=84406 RepID=UPI000909A250|nr:MULTISPECIES: class II fructose-bisphosphate aldolase [Virgibacillus]API91983.1 tagatose-bisphosphate aldolase [Virgibacillus sp. 6R]MBS7430440.1 class II fructose-bisphosphate aldolase [Virgibacillus sp. 19R1-5]MBU8566378.1 class II fructose-bisphosphate aldolase [Virgibacillus pantothenticus]MBU8600206.1 class II fructose-bisphosphate aldolase [Virgibacillus pantothenticus]MBU8633862.1 class II fructose-bisphosphate aldolase [Virgibacillus pantothenticus]